MRAREGLGSMDQVLRLAHHFEPKTLAKILGFHTAERTNPFVKNLQQNIIMQSGVLPQPKESPALRDRQEGHQLHLVGPYKALENFRFGLRDNADIQRRAFARVGNRESGFPDDDDIPPEAEEEELRASQRRPDLEAAAAYFMPSELCQRPSDYVAQLAQHFEAGSISPKTGKMVPKVLKKDQTLFLAQFASACNTVWDDDKEIKNGALEMKHRRCFNMLLIGQGGSGKTALIQEFVLPTMDFLFPAEDEHTTGSTLIVCATWSQAENISTEKFKALTCHRAGIIGVQAYRNRLMTPVDKKVRLVRRWGGLLCLIIEETSMIAPGIYNMLLYRSFHGRS